MRRTGRGPRRPPAAGAGSLDGAAPDGPAENVRAPGLTVRGYLDAPLGLLRLRDLTDLLAGFTGRPLAETVADLRAELATSHLDREDSHRLHILISHLYHRCGADLPLTESLRADLRAALTRCGPTANRPRTRR